MNLFSGRKLTNMAKVCCLILNYNDSETTRKLLDYIKGYSAFSDILVVDNCSTDDSWDDISSFRDISNLTVVKTEKNGGYGAGNNFGIKYAFEKFNSDYVLLSNPDVIFSEELVYKLIEPFHKDTSVACSTAIQYDIEHKPIKDFAWKLPNSFDYAFMTTRVGQKLSRLDYDLQDVQKSETIEVDCVPGALIMYDVKKFLEIGGYDEEMFLYCEEATIGYKIKEKGYKTILLGGEKYYHEHSVSIDKSIPNKKKQMSLIFKNRILFMKKYLHSNNLWICITKVLQNRRLRKMK